jgi:hypothetical protein
MVDTPASITVPDVVEATATDIPPESSNGAGTSAVENDAGPEIVVDRTQLHLDGMAPAGQERLPIFTPAPATPPAAEDRTAPTRAPRRVPAPEGRAASRYAIYILVVIVALVVVAGLAYLAGRSAHAPSTPTEQLP